LVPCSIRRRGGDDEGEEEDCNDDVVAEIASVFDKNASPTCRTFSKVFEDNNAALQLAKVPRTTLRNRHFAVKYHFFREHVARGDIEISRLPPWSKKRTSLLKDLRENYSRPFGNYCVDGELDFGDNELL
jgi:hypothetical protein